MNNNSVRWSQIVLTVFKWEHFWFNPSVMSMKEKKAPACKADHLLWLVMWWDDEVVFSPCVCDRFSSSPQNNPTIVCRSSSVWRHDTQRTSSTVTADCATLCRASTVLRAFPSHTSSACQAGVMAILLGTSLFIYRKKLCFWKKYEILSFEAKSLWFSKLPWSPVVFDQKLTSWFWDW